MSNWGLHAPTGYRGYRLGTIQVLPDIMYSAAAGHDPPPASGQRQACAPGPGSAYCPAPKLAGATGKDNWETGGLPGHDGGICPEDSAWGGRGADGGPLSVSPRSTLLRIGRRGLEEEPQAAEQRGAGDAGWALWRVGRRPWSVIQIVASCEAFPFCADCAWRRKFRPRGRVSSVNVIC